jgi:predicted NBD/HSP70 family sugar kinase
MGRVKSFFVLVFPRFDMITRPHFVISRIWFSRLRSPQANRHCRLELVFRGPFSRKTGWVKNANSTWLNGKPFQKDISDYLNRRVQVTNDANCLAVSEATDGAGKGYELVFAGILGTGCGAGLAYKGKPIVGPNGVAGEWGHNPLPWDITGRVGCTPMLLR